MLIYFPSVNLILNLIYNGNEKSNVTTSKKLSGASSVNMKANHFHKLFLDELKDIYWAEKHLTKNLPKLAKGVTTEDLEEAFNNHLEETNEQVVKLERIFEILGEKAVAKNVMQWKDWLKKQWVF